MLSEHRTLTSPIPSDRMYAYKLPPTRKKPTDVSDTYNTDYNVRDEIVQEDEKQVPQT
jgi:hypothetical protein